MHPEHQRRAASFGAAAQTYDRGRPSYPTRALDWLLPPQAHRVLDLGAGTGKLTRLLQDRGLTVVAVEPSSGMRQQLTATVPAVPVYAGTAEQIPLEDGCLDAVLVAQAWHWVDPSRAVPEVARVLTPGATLGALWNVRDERTDWVAELGALLRSVDPQGTDAVAPQLGEPFGPVERLDLEWNHTLAPETLCEMVASRSAVILLSPDKRAALLAEVRTLLATHPTLAGAERLMLPYVTRCFRARRS